MNVGMNVYIRLSARHFVEDKSYFSVAQILG